MGSLTFGNLPKTSTRSMPWPSWPNNGVWVTDTLLAAVVSGIIQNKTLGSKNADCIKVNSGCWIGLWLCSDHLRLSWKMNLFFNFLDKNEWKYTFQKLISYKRHKFNKTFRKYLPSNYEQITFTHSITHKLLEIIFNRTGQNVESGKMYANFSIILELGVYPGPSNSVYYVYFAFYKIKKV